MKHKIPPSQWHQGVPPGEGFVVYRSPLGYDYYRSIDEVSLWVSGNRRASLCVGPYVVELSRNELLQLKLEIDKVYKEIDKVYKEIDT